jgi:hypothetical protein
MHPTSDNKHREAECRGCSPGVVVRVSHVGCQDARCTVMNASESDLARHKDEEEIIHDADEAAHYSMQQNKKTRASPAFRRLTAAKRSANRPSMGRIYPCRRLSHTYAQSADLQPAS